MTFPGFKLVLAGQDVTDEDKVHHRANATLAVRALSRSRLSQLRAAILLGLTREIFGFQDRVCCIGGIPDSGQLDTVLVVDVDEEFESVIGQGDEMLPEAYPPKPSNALRQSPPTWPPPGGKENPSAPCSSWAITKR